MSTPDGANPVGGAFGVSAIIPCYNEIECITSTYAQVAAELDRYDDAEIVFVDDGSTDATLAAIKAIAAGDPRVRYAAFSRNFGQEAAFSAGFKYATKAWCVQLDADLQSPPAAMHALLGKALQGYDAVFAVRQARQDGWFRRIGGSGYQRLAVRLGIEVPIGASTFRVLRTSVAKKIVATRLAHPYFLATVPRLGARYTTLVTTHRPRAAGVSKWSLKRLFGHALELFFGFSYRLMTPVYLLAAIEVVLVGAALAFGSTTLVAGAAALGAAASGVSAAIMARYLVRMMHAQPGPPRYLIREANFAIDPADNLYEYEMSANPGDAVIPMPRSVTPHATVTPHVTVTPQATVTPQVTVTQLGTENSRP